MIYRFKISFEDEEDFERWIDVKTNATFYEFHNAIQDTLLFNKKEDAVFFVVNDNWKKLKEIPVPADNPKDANCTIASAIMQPYQKFIYVADKTMEWTLEIELNKILDETLGVVYPHVFKSIGKPPRQSGLLLSEEELAQEMEQIEAGSRAKLDLELPGLGDVLGDDDDDEAKEDSDDYNLDEFPDLGDIDEIDFSKED